MAGKRGSNPPAGDFGITIEREQMLTDLDPHLEEVVPARKERKEGETPDPTLTHQSDDGTTVADVIGILKDPARRGGDGVQGGLLEQFITSVIEHSGQSRVRVHVSVEVEPVASAPSMRAGPAPGRELQVTEDAPISVEGFQTFTGTFTFGNQVAFLDSALLARFPGRSSADVRAAFTHFSGRHAPGSQGSVTAEAGSIGAQPALFALLT